MDLSPKDDYDSSENKNTTQLLPSSIDPNNSARVNLIAKSDSIDDKQPSVSENKENNEKKPVDVDALMKKLEEHDKMLRELDELEKKDHKKNKKLTATASTETTITTLAATKSTKSTTTTSSTGTSTEIATIPKPITVSTTDASTTTTTELTESNDNNSVTTSLAGLSLTTTNGSTLSSSMPSLIDPHQQLEKIKSQLNSKPPGPSISPQELDRLMEKLAQDNRILAELDQKVKKVSTSNISSPVLLSSSLPTLTGLSHLALLPSLYSQLVPVTDRSILARDKRLLLPNNTYLDDDLESLLLLQQLQKSQELFADDIADCIEIPNRGRCRVFIARYSYDPFKQSPNDNPEVELYLAAGDFILVFGDIDEDGFYFGELLDGRRGMVPSNFVEKLTGEDLFEFQASVLYEGRDGDESTCSYPPEFYDAILDDAMAHTSFQHLIAPEDFHRMNDYIELEESSEIDEEDLSDPERAQANAARDQVMPPKRLILERQLLKSILIGWLPPDCPRSYIDNYQIYVDGVLKVTVPSIERTKALVEGVDSSIPHRVSVRAITPQGRASRDAACTIVVGKNVPFAPSCVKATNISATSALISWLPSNSNFYHVVAVNSVEVKTVGSSINKHLITGLAPNTLYRVSVRAKPGKLLCSEEKNPKKLEMLTTFVDFRTLPKSLPEPPVDVQVESGPQEGTLLVTWLPVTLDQFGTSNGCPVTGYAVFAAHKKLAEIDSPTSDHALLDITQLESFSKKAVTVRTKSGENLSQDSIPCQIPDDLIKMTIHRKIEKPCGEMLFSLQQNQQPLQLPYYNNNQYSLSYNNNMHGQQSYNTNQQQINRGHSDSESESEMNQLMSNVARRSQVFDPSPSQGQMGHPTMKATIRNQPSTIQQQRQPQNYPQTSNQQHSISQQQAIHQNPMQSQQFQIQQPQQQHLQHSMNQPHSNQNQSQHPMQQQQNLANRNMPMNQQHSQQQQNNQMQQQSFQGLQGHGSQAHNPSRTNVPSNAITKKTPNNGGNSVNRAGGPSPSPQPPVRNRQYTDYERSHLGTNQGRGAMASGVSNQNRFVGPNGQQQRDARLFVALYDYDPLTMSPNPDAANEELPFREGDIIKIYGDKDPDGFFRGELNGRMGFVPCNMVSEAQLDQETGALIKGPNDPWAHLPVKKMIALYDYDPQELSPNPDTEMELAFRAGDCIYVYGDMDEDGFYMGELNGYRGLVPSNFLTEAIDGTTRHGSQTQANRSRPGETRSQLPHSQFQQGQSQQQQQQQHRQQEQPTHQHHQEPGHRLQQQQQQHHHLQGTSGHPAGSLPQSQTDYGQHQYQGHQGPMGSSNPPGAQLLGQGMRPQGQYGAQSMQQTHQGQQHHHGLHINKQRPNSLDLGSNQRINQGGMPSQGGGNAYQIGQQNQIQHQQHMQQHQQTQQHHNHNQQQQLGATTNSLSTLFAGGKKILEEAITPRSGQPPTNFGTYGPQSSNQLQQSNIVQGGNKFGQGSTTTTASQQQHYAQSNHSSLQNQQQGFNQSYLASNQGLAGSQQSQQQQGPTLSGALGAVKSIFKI